MKLYVMRHGPAEDRAPSGRDFDRALTVPGREVVERSARALAAAHGGGELRVIASPFRRARETAEIVASILGAGEPELHDDLGADGDVPFTLVREVRSSERDTLLVGHQPIVEELVRALASPARVPLPAGFRTAIVVGLEHAGEDRWHLGALIDPHALAAR